MLRRSMRNNGEEFYEFLMVTTARDSTAIDKKLKSFGEINVYVEEILIFQLF